MATPLSDLESYLEEKGRAWSGGRYIVPDQVARHVRTQGASGLAEEFRADATKVAPLVDRRSRRQLLSVATSALDLAAPEVADASRIVVGGLRLARTDKVPGTRRSTWWAAGAAATVVVGVRGLAAFKHRQ